MQTRPRRERPLSARDTAEQLAPTDVVTEEIAVVASDVPAREATGVLRSPMAILREVREAAGPVGMLPLWILLGVSAAERFDFTAYGVLGPEIRRAFSLTNSEYQAIAGLAAIAPLLLAVPIGAWADRTNRVRLARWGALLWGITCVGTGLAPAIVLFVLFRIAGGSGQTVNQPVHPSLLADYYPPEALAPVFSFYLLAPAAIGLIAGPLAGGVSAVFGWRLAFILLALPTFALVAVMGRLQEPRRGQSLGVVVNEDDPVTMGESFRRLKAIRSLKRTWWAAAFFGGGVIAFGNLLSIFFNDVYHQGAFARGAISAEFGLAGIVGLVIGGPLAQREMRLGRPERLALVNGALVVLFGAGIALMAISPVLAGSLLGVFVLSIGAAGFSPAYTTMVALVTPPKLRSQAYAWSIVWVALGAAIVSPTIGSFGDAFNQRVAALVLAALVGMAGFVEITATRFVTRDIAEAAKNASAADVGSLLTVRGLDVAYEGGVQVLFGVDFDVRAGEIIALLGTNGAGKSTLLRAISGLMDPIGGVIYFDGRDITHADAVTKTGMGIVQVPGGRGVFPSLTVAENLKIAGWMYRKDAEYLREATERVLEHFPILREYWELPAANLSGGQQQMLTLAQALLAKPKLLMIDELSLGLAPVIVEQLLQTVRALAADGTTIILVEQSVNVALTIADTAYFMEKGEVRFNGPTAGLLERPDVLRSVFLEGAGSVDGEATSATKARTPARARRVARTDGEPDVAVLSVRGVTKRFGGVTANQDVSFDLLDGQILGIIGPNGAGKTTLFDLLCGYAIPDQGKVELLGEDITSLPPDARAWKGLGRSFQDAKLFPALTVNETIALSFEKRVDVRDPVAAALNLPSVAQSEREVAQHVDELVELMNLSAFRDKFIGELSTGSRRIVDLACILATEPKVILFDEPSSGIAQRETEALGPLLTRIREATGASLLVIEHDMPLITSISDEILALDLGEVVTQGAPEDVINDPRVVSSYLGSSDEVVNRSGAVLPGKGS
jgi:branched-chain amino acid transport system ATP-binding protein